MVYRHVWFTLVAFLLCTSARGQVISVPNLTDAQGQVVRLEYFFDTDPGEGKGVPIDFTASEQGLIELNLDLTLEGLSTGMHRLFIRAENGRGEWSSFVKTAFLISPFATKTLPGIQKGEFFLGTDPGEGNGNLVEPNVTASDAVEFSFQAPPLSPGHHALHFRAQDALGNWSMPVKHSFLQFPEIRATGVEWSVLEGEEIIASGSEFIEPPASRFSATLATPLAVDASFNERSLKAQARLIIEERIPSIPQSFTLEMPTLVEPLRMITPPANQMLTAGDSLSLSVTVAGGGELRYQWFHNDQPIPNAVSATLEIGAVSVDDAGSYYVEIEGPVGNLQSQTAILTVNDPNPPVGETVYHPADANQDGRIVIGEVTAYGSAWKRGDTWPTEPNPIPIGYLTRAGALWKGGEVYEKDATVAQAPLWWVSLNQGVRPLAYFHPKKNPNQVSRKVDHEDVIVEIHPGPTTQAYAFEEIIPQGYTAVSISHGGVFDDAVNQVRWGPFIDQEPRNLRYALRARSGQAIPHLDLIGTASFDGFQILLSGTEPSSINDNARPLSIRITDPFQARITVRGEVGETYRIESSDTLGRDGWQQVGVITLDAATQHWSPGRIISKQNRFYRFIKHH